MTTVPMPVNPKDNRFERHPKKTLFVIVLSSFLILDLLLTAAYHHIKYGSIHKKSYAPVIMQKSPLFHHTLLPNLTVSSGRWGPLVYSIVTNSLGFRDKTIRQVSLTFQNSRIVFLGDSFTEGVGLEYEKTFVGIVDETLARKGIQVLNAGVTSYSPAIYLKKTEWLVNEVGLRFTHLVIVMDISDTQDEAQLYDVRNGRVVFNSYFAVLNFINRYTTVPKNVVKGLLNLKAKVSNDPETLRSDEDKKYGINMHRSLWTVNQSIFAEYGEAGLSKAKGHMDQLFDLAKQHNIQMMLVVYPYPDQIFYNDLNSIQVRFWRDWARQHSVRFIDLFPDFIQKTQDPKRLIRDYFIEGDVHWNENGHRLVAKRLLEELSIATP